ncbi:MAG TPA: adenylate/guanylate cyclase domain-containing protein [Casimicrobiaceae bacterium]|nr:adenylate/guanylate cyclase domain-containing protein [Casimicrobiaceae bacterium]
MNAPTSELAVLFADVSGSTRLYETLGDERALAAIAHCLDIAKSACAGYGGRVIKTIGDEVMVTFAAADDAAQGAAELQARIAAEPAQAGLRLMMRVGFHHGVALALDGDVYGDSVNVAARLVGVAQGGQIITSGTTAALLAPWLRIRTRELAALTLKGKTHDVNVCELVWQDASDDMTTLSTRVRTPPTQLLIRHGARELLLDEANGSAALGRDAQNEIVIADRMASRMHAKIERRRDRYVLIDHSSNGTFLTIAGEPEIRLNREEYVLRGHGRVSFGHPHANDPSETIEFFCGANAAGNATNR